MAERWYVVEAFEGRDEDVALRLVAAGFKAWRPVHTVRSAVREPLARSGRLARRITKHPRFGRYLFLRVDLDNERRDYVVSAVTDMRGVKDFVRGAGADAPAVVPDELIAFFREHRPERASASAIAAFAEGDVVRILAGPFEGLHGPIESIDKAGVVKVVIQIFGRPTPIPIEVGHVELLVQGRRPPKSSTSKRCANRNLAQIA